MAGSASLKHELLSGPLKKIERAKKHVNDLNRQITEYLAAEPLRLRIRQRDNPPSRLIYIDAKPAIPNDFPLIVGDAVHNLRSAIDHICWGMVGDKAKNPRSVGFPFVELEERLSSAIATRQMNVAPKNVVDEIHALQPYPSGNKYFHAVKALDERDKHHVLLIVGYGVELRLAEFSSLVGPERLIGFEIDETHRISSVGDFVMPLDPPVEIFDREADFQPTFTIGFGDGEALVGLPLVSSLKAMTEATEDAVRRLAAAFFR
jgi:hypothetical protein